MLMGCFTCGLTYYAALPLAVVGFIVGFFARGNLLVAGLTLNLLALIPAIILAVMLAHGKIEADKRERDRDRERPGRFRSD